jgi:hypothetical protein
MKKSTVKKWTPNPTVSNRVIRSVTRLKSDTRISKIFNDSFVKNLSDADGSHKNNTIHQAHACEIALTITDTPEQLHANACTLPHSTILDGGATIHILGDKKLFDPNSFVQVNMSIIIAKGVVTATLMGTGVFVSNDLLVTLPNALYLPGVSNNLISESRFELQGCAIHSENGVRVVYNTHTLDTQVIGYLVEGLYRVKIDHTSHANITQTYTKGLNKLDLLHNRLGHVNEGYIRKMYDIPKGTVMSHCDSCARALSKKQPYNKSRKVPLQITKRLDYVVVDVIVKMGGYSIHGNAHLGVVMDVYSRRRWGLPLRTKGCLADDLTTLLRLLTTETGSPPRHLRSDGGGEIDNNSIESLCKELGIKYTTTTLKGSNQNPSAERVILSVEEGTRVMVLHAGAPQMFWEHAALFAIEVQNKVWHRAINDTPYNRWNEVKMDIKAQHRYVRTWGCLCYAHILDINTGKLGERARQCVFLGIDAKRSGVVTWILDERKLGVSRNVTFNETVFPFRSPLPPRITTTTHTHEEEEKHTTNTDNNTTTQRKSIRTWQPTKQALRNLAQVCEVDDWKQALNNQYRAARSLDHVCMQVLNNVEMLHAVTAYADVSVPKSLREAQACKYWPQWRAAMQREYDAIIHNNTWREVAYEKGMVPLPCMWVFAVKHGGLVEEKIFKARLVVCGNNQVQGRDYTETFSAVARMKSVRIIIAIATILGWPLRSSDIGNAYLNAHLQETVYMRHPALFPGAAGTVLLLLKSLYGLKQAGREWAKLLVSILTKLDFKPLISDSCVFVHKSVIMGVHVDDFVCTAEDENFILDINNRMSKVLKVKYLGELTIYVGLQVTREGDKTHVHQTAYHNRLLKRFQMDSCNPSPTPSTDKEKLSTDDGAFSEEEKIEMEKVPYKSVVGSLLYSALGTRPDISQAVIECAQFSQNPGPKHWRALKKVLRYMAGTRSHGITYYRVGEFLIKVFCDSDWAGDLDTRKSRTGLVIYFAGGPIIWVSRLQKSQALSSCEAEFMALCDAMTECLWLIQFLYELGIKHNQPIPIYIDNQAAIALAYDPVHHQRSKHIDLRYKFMKTYVAQGVFELYYIPTKENISDLLTKSTSVAVFRHLVEELVREVSV